MNWRLRNTLKRHLRDTLELVNGRTDKDTVAVEFEACSSRNAKDNQEHNCWPGQFRRSTCKAPAMLRALTFAAIVCCLGLTAAEVGYKLSLTCRGLVLRSLWSCQSIRRRHVTHSVKGPSCCRVPVTCKVERCTSTRPTRNAVQLYLGYWAFPAEA